jgi:hypothetical protein
VGRAFLRFALGLALCLLAPALRASPGAVAIEVEARAEALIDARAVRRLVQLELGDVTVPPLPGEVEARLFVRVLVAADNQLRVELWERGEAYGTRLVVGARDSAQLLARRVALATAALARELRERRRDEAEARARERRLAAARARVLRERTLDGPRALRVGIQGSLGRELALLGPSLTAELHAYHATRLDVGTSFGFGIVAPGAAAESFALSFGPARRFVLSPSWDLDLGLQAEAAVLELLRVRSVDGIPGEQQTWSARIEARARLEPRLSRGVRLALGLGGGTLLRDIPLTLENGEARRVRGLFVSSEVALVLTPF